MLENPSALNFNNQMLDLDKVQISYSAIEQMMGNHAEFSKYLGQFKTSLAEEKGQTNLKYLLCRLDFNEYYQVKAMKEEEEKKKGDRRSGNGGNFDEMNDDYGDEGDEDDEDDEDDEEDDDDQNLGGGAGGQYSMNSGYPGGVNQSYNGNSISQQKKPPIQHNFRANDSVEMPPRSSYS